MVVVRGRRTLDAINPPFRSDHDEHTSPSRVPRAFSSLVSLLFCFKVNEWLIYVIARRDDLEELVQNPTYFQAIFHSLQRVKDLYNQQAELGLANESIASTYNSPRS
jgi:Modifier of rudimentary (Mod(r)) protein